MDSATVVDDPIQFANALKAFAELRQSNAIDEAEYSKLKVEVLAALERCIKRGPMDVPLPSATPSFSKGIDGYAGDLHRALADTLAREYPCTTLQDEKKRYLMELAARLIAQGSLHASDMEPLAKMIQTMMDDGHAQSLQMMATGRMEINAVHRQLRESATSSELARTIAGIVSDSAEKAVDMVVSAPPNEPPPAATSRRQSLWNMLKDDGMGAMVGAATASTIIAGPGFPIASLAVLGALGPAAAVMPVLGAIIGGGMMSGFALAATKS